MTNLFKIVVIPSIVYGLRMVSVSLKPGCSIKMITHREALKLLSHGRINIIAISFRGKRILSIVSDVVKCLRNSFISVFSPDVSS